MAVYTILRPENLHDSLKGKPRWMTCVVFAAGLLIMTLSAVAAGVFIGYTYCYVEHRTGFRTAGNVSQAQDLRVFTVPLGDTKVAKQQNSINGALVASQFVQRILKIGQIWDNDHAYLPGPHEDNHFGKLERET